MRARRYASDEAAGSERKQLMGLTQNGVVQETRRRRRTATGTFPCPARGFGACEFLARSRGSEVRYPRGGCPFIGGLRRPCGEKMSPSSAQRES